MAVRQLVTDSSCCSVVIAIVIVLLLSVDRRVQESQYSLSDSRAGFWAMLQGSGTNPCGNRRRAALKFGGSQTYVWVFFF